LQIKVINKINDKIIEYQQRTGATKTWISNKLGISKARLYQICEAENMMLDVAIKFSIFFECEIMDLFEYKILDENKNIV